MVVKETGGWQELFSLVDENGKLIRKLDPKKYFVCFNPDEYVYFAIFGLRAGLDDGPGWTAINAEEKVLFNVYNASSGEPSPDYLVDNKIRIVDNDNLIGYADLKGEIIIEPQFEVATSFHKGKAIVGKNCKKVPSDKHANESDCNHSSIICDKYGYINDKGTLIKIGAYTFEQIMHEIGWKMPDE
ncbi:hypothetical protein GCM10007389_01260 [Pontibacter akesuensis]|nr:hypothetical protein GCM10007389_01260 [Pontibacter akesuensis]